MLRVTGIHNEIVNAIIWNVANSVKNVERDVKDEVA